MLFNDVPDFIHIHTLIDMNQDVPEPGNSAPWRLGISLGEFG